MQEDPGHSYTKAAYFVPKPCFFVYFFFFFFFFFCIYNIVSIYNMLIETNQLPLQGKWLSYEYRSSNCLNTVGLL